MNDKNNNLLIRVTSGLTLLPIVLYLLYLGGWASAGLFAFAPVAFQIYTADVVFDASDNITGIANERELTHDLNVVNWGPYWHPDGRHIMYASSGRNHLYDLWLMRDDGTQKTRITFDAGADVLPSFSSDGRYLLWTSKRNGQSTQVYLARFRLPRGS